MLTYGLFVIALFFFVYWLLGSVRWLLRPGWPRRARWLAAALVAAWFIAFLRGGFIS